MRHPLPGLAVAGLLCALAAPVRAGGGKDLDFTAADGTPLKATYHAAAGPGPGVLLLHMCNSDRKAWAGLAPMLAAKGIHVLAMDYRGYGESGGAPYPTWAPEERRRIVSKLWPGDIDRALALLEAQPGVDRKRIGAGGGSCGVNNSVQLARRHPEVLTLALLAGGTDEAGQAFLARSSWMPLFGAAARDDGGSVDLIRWILGFSSNPQNTVKIYPDGGHGTQIFAVHADLEPMIAAWFVEHLVTHPVERRSRAGPPGPSARMASLLAGNDAGKKLRARFAAGGAAALPPEGVVNNLGYQHLRGGRPEVAIAILAVNAEAHPGSANAHDSLSEAYEVAGDRARSADAARKALEALARDPNMSEATRRQIREACEKRIQAAGAE